MSKGDQHVGQIVSTHSRAEAAAKMTLKRNKKSWFQHTAARRRLLLGSTSFFYNPKVSTHSRAEAAAECKLFYDTTGQPFQHTAARRRLPEYRFAIALARETFQHTAARRRLPQSALLNFHETSVSTHSRAEAAALSSKCARKPFSRFNTQPRGGGCTLPKKARKISVLNTSFR